MILNVSLLQQSFHRACPTYEGRQLFAELFYETLRTASPEVWPLFAHTDMRTQQKKLMSMLTFILSTLNDPSSLVPALQHLGQRHAALGVTSEHYALVSEALLATFAVLLGSGWSQELQQEWTEAITTIATVMQERGVSPATQD